MSDSNRKIKKKEVLDRVAGDSKRVPYEKETIFRFNREEKKIHVSSFDPTIIKGLLRHQYFEVDDMTENKRGRIVGISGKLPRGVIKVKKKPRKRDYPSTIISTESMEQ